MDTLLVRAKTITIVEKNRIYSVLPDYLCHEWITEGKLALIFKPTKAVTNQILLAYRKSERQSQQTALLLDQF